MRAPVAQGIERRFPKPCVAGSNPARGANVMSQDIGGTSRPWSAPNGLVVLGRIQGEVAQW
jgi:hypothetical protein